MIVEKQIENLLKNNDIITKQSSFTIAFYETAIQIIIDDQKLIINKGKMIRIIFMDLKRMFETVDRDRLLEKLFQYGIKEVVLQ